MTQLQVELVNQNAAEGRGTWRLTADLIYQSDIGGLITVPAGFVTDFASVPRIPIIFDAFGDKASEAATVHDAIYAPDFHHFGMSRETADAILREATLAPAHSELLADALWGGVRLAGESHWGV